MIALLCLRGYQVVRGPLHLAARIASRYSRFSGKISNGSGSYFNSRRLLPSSLLAHRQMLIAIPRQTYLRRLGVPFRLSLRLAHLALIFGSALIMVGPLWLLLPRDRTLSGIHRICYWALRQAGATFIKLGQWASTRPDILPPELCSVLARLHMRAPAHGMAWNRYIFAREFGRPLEQVFESFESQPIGSGTVAQVHRATLRADGRPVAVKICHPHIDERIGRDLQIMSLAATLLNPLAPWMNLPEEVRYFARIMREQLDLRHEAYTLDHFARNFATWRTVHVPLPIYPYISPSVLTETYASGTSIGQFTDPHNKYTSELASVERAMKRQLAITGLSSFLQMLLWDNFVHADLHPGNILVRFVDRHGNVAWTEGPDEELWRRVQRDHLIPQLVYLDTGLITTLSRRDRDNFNDLFMALVLRGDGYQAGRLIIERSPRDRGTARDPDGFCRRLDGLIRPLFREATSLDLKRLSLGPTLFRVFDLVREHQVLLDGSFTNLVMSFVCVEGLGRALSPDLNLIPMLVKGALQYLVTEAAHRVS